MNEQNFNQQNYNQQGNYQPNYNQQNYNQQNFTQQGWNPYGGYNPQMYKKRKSDNSGLAAGSLALGISSLVFFLMFFVSMPLAIVAVILGIVSLAKYKKGRGLAVGGIVTSVITIVLYFVIIASIVNSNAFKILDDPKAAEDFLDSIDDLYDLYGIDDYEDYNDFSRDSRDELYDDLYKEIYKLENEMKGLDQTL